MPKDCTTARSTANRREYWVSLRRPLSPSLRSAFHGPYICPVNWTMIDAEMYGTTLRANRLKRCKAPPENMLNMSTMVPFWLSISCSMAWGLTPGTGMKLPTR